MLASPVGTWGPDGPAGTLFLVSFSSSESSKKAPKPSGGTTLPPCVGLFKGLFGGALVVGGGGGGGVSYLDLLQATFQFSS